MALQLDASTPALVTKTATGTTMVTASFTAPANALLVAHVAYDSGSSTGNNHTVTDSGGLTWTRAGRKSKDAGSTGGAGEPGGVEIWTAQTTSSAARTVTATQASAFHGALAVKVITDSNGGTPSPGAIAAGSSASGTPSLAVTTTAADSWVWAQSSDWSQRGLGTAGTGQTITDEYNPSGFLTTHTWRQNTTTPTSGTAVTMNLTAPTAQQYNLLSFEVKAGTGGSSVTATPTGIATAEAFGAHTAQLALTAQPGGIPTGEAHGTPMASLALTAAPTGIATAEAHGTPTAALALTASPTGVPTAEGLGTPTAVTSGDVIPTGIPTGEAHGTPTAQLALTASPTGIPTGEAHGTPTAQLALTAQPGGIATGEALGTPAAVLDIVAVATGIPTAEAFGTPSSADANSLTATAQGIPSAELLGQPAATRTTGGGLRIHHRAGFEQTARS